MAIVASDVVFYKASVNTDASSNGGGPTATQVTSLFPNVTGDERSAGLTRYRKAFVVNKQTDGQNGEADLTLYNAKIYLRTISPGNDYFRLCKSPATLDGFWDTQAQSSAGTGDYANWSGVGTLDANITQGTQNFDVVCEHASGFNANRLLCITDGVNREFISCSGVTWVSTTATVNTSGVANAYNRSYFTPKTATAGLCDSTHIGTTAAGFGVDAYNGKLVRITGGTGSGQVRRVLDTTAEQLTVTYAWATTPDGTSVYEVIKTYVSEVLELGDLVAQMTPATWDETAAGTPAGTYDIDTYPLVGYGGGTIMDDWTLSFVTSSTVSIVGDRAGTVITGAPIASNITPTRNGANLFTITPHWGVNWLQGDSVTFSTSPGMWPFWVKQVVTAGTAPCGDNYWEIMATGDSA